MAGLVLNDTKMIWFIEDGMDKKRDRREVDRRVMGSQKQTKKHCIGCDTSA